MHGNVWEWTSSEWRADYSRRGAGVAAPEGGKRGDINPSAVAPAEVTVRVFRGGSCWNGAWFVRSACRGRNRPQMTRRIRGFRVLLPAARSGG